MKLRRWARSKRCGLEKAGEAYGNKEVGLDIKSKFHYFCFQSRVPLFENRRIDKICSFFQFNVSYCTKIIHLLALPVPKPLQNDRFYQW
jgi:hypothetical protein